MPTEEEKLAKKAKKAAKAATKAGSEAKVTASPARRQSPRIQAMAAAAQAVPAFDLSAPKATVDVKADKKAKKRGASGDDSQDPPAKKSKVDKVKSSDATEKKEKKEKLSKEEKAAKKAAKEEKKSASGKKRKAEEDSNAEADSETAKEGALSADEYRSAHDISGSSTLPDPVQRIEDVRMHSSTRALACARGHECLLKHMSALCHTMYHLPPR